MSKINDWVDRLFWVGIVLTLLGITMDAIRQEEWSWGLGLSIAGLVVLLISLTLGIADMKRSKRRVRNYVKNK